MIEGLTGLLKSRKAIVLVIVVGIAAAMLHLGHIDADHFTSLLKVLVPGWMLAHAGEQGAKSIANKKPAERD